MSMAAQKSAMKNPKNKSKNTLRRLSENSRRVLTIRPEKFAFALEKSARNKSPTGSATKSPRIIPSAARLFFESPFLFWQRAKKGMSRLEKGRQKTSTKARLALSTENKSAVWTRAIAVT